MKKGFSELVDNLNKRVFSKKCSRVEICQSMFMCSAKKEKKKRKKANSKHNPAQIIVKECIHQRKSET